MNRIETKGFSKKISESTLNDVRFFKTFPMKISDCYSTLNIKNI